MDVSPHELLESVKEKSELKVGIVVLVVGLKDLHMEKNDTGQEGLVAHLMKRVREKRKERNLLELLFKLLLLSDQIDECLNPLKSCLRQINVLRKFN